MQLHLHPVGYATKVGSGQFKIDNRCVIVIIFYNKIIKPILFLFIRIVSDIL